MPRVHVFVPDEVQQLMAERPELNYSRLFQEAVRTVVGCDHERMACRRCDQPVHIDALREAWLVGFFDDLRARLEVLVHNAGTAQGAAMLLREAAIAWRIPGARDYRPPRPARSVLRAARRDEIPQPTPSLREEATA